jgi:hypothetical protein
MITGRWHHDNGKRKDGGSVIMKIINEEWWQCKMVMRNSDGMLPTILTLTVSSSDPEAIFWPSEEKQHHRTFVWKSFVSTATVFPVSLSQTWWKNAAQWYYTEGMKSRYPFMKPFIFRKIGHKADSTEPTFVTWMEADGNGWKRRLKEQLLTLIVLSAEQETTFFSSGENAAQCTSSLWSLYVR